MNKWQKISVQPHIFIMHAVNSDTCMQSKSMGCTEVILKDPGADSRVRGKFKWAEKKCREELLFCAIFTACLDFPLPLLSAPGSPRIYGDLI